jgi:predicted extracellular nuclease
VLAGSFLPINTANTLRGGSTLSTLIGPLYINTGFSRYWRVQTASAADLEIVGTANPRPDAAPELESSQTLVKVVNTNVLKYAAQSTRLPLRSACPRPSNCSRPRLADPHHNPRPLSYWVTVGPAGTLRGADNAAEFERQVLKTVGALAKMDADVYGVIELENLVSTWPPAICGDDAAHRTSAAYCPRPS